LDKKKQQLRGTTCGVFETFPLIPEILASKTTYCSYTNSYD